eukprot:SAG11_NODE_8530_length_1005_cov_1.146799_1_plen_150_part_00
MDGPRVVPFVRTALCDYTERTDGVKETEAHTHSCQDLCFEPSVQYGYKHRIKRARASEPICECIESESALYCKARLLQGHVEVVSSDYASCPDFAVIYRTLTGTDVSDKLAQRLAGRAAIARHHGPHTRTKRTQNLRMIDEKLANKLMS